MVFLFALEYIFIIGFILVMLFQVVLPLMMGTPVFPSLRWRKLSNEAAQAKELLLQLDEIEALDDLKETVDARLTQRGKRVKVTEDKPQTEGESSGTN